MDIVTFPALACIYPNPKFYVKLQGYMGGVVLVVAVIVGAWFMAIRRGRALGLDMYATKKRLTDNMMHTLVFFLFFIYPMMSAQVRPNPEGATLFVLCASTAP
jgi:hypothetical protein